MSTSGGSLTDKTGGSAKLQLVTDAISRLVGIQAVLKEVNETRNEWYRFSEHASKVLECVLDILPSVNLESSRVERSVDDLKHFIPRIDAVCRQFDKKGDRKKLLQSDEYTSQLKALQVELDDKVRLLQLNMDIEQRQFLESRLDALNLHQLEMGVDSIRDEIRNIPVTADSPPAILDTLPYASGASWNSLNTCMPGTRTSLLEDVTNWMRSANTTGPAQIYWIVGVAGSGKTALANSLSSIAAEKNWLVSSFFFNRMSDERNKPEKFVTTFARDLAGRDTGIADAIATKLGYDVSLRSTADIVRQFRELVLGPVKSWERSDPAVVIMDALDEGFDDGILQVLTSEVQKLPGFFRLVVTSRPLAEFSVVLDDGAHVIRHALNTTDMGGRQDVRTYMRQRLAAISLKRRLRQPWPEPALADALVTRAEGLFQWAFTVTEYLAKCLNPDRQLRLILSLQGAVTISSRMDQLYATVLETVRALEDDDFVDAYGMFMGSILAAKEPLTLSAMRMLHGDASVDPFDLLDQLRSLIVGIDSDHEPIRILHLSLSDFLTQRAVEPFRLSPQSSSQAMAFLCVQLINDRLLEETSALPKLNPDAHSGNVIFLINTSSLSDGLHYAVSFWTRHLQDVTESPQDLLDGVIVLLDRHLLDWISLTISLGAYIGLAGITKWLRKCGVKGEEAIRRISAGNWDWSLSFISELLRRNGRLEEACAAAEDSLAAVFGVSWDDLADMPSTADSTTGPSSTRSLERGASISRVAVQHIRRVSNDYPHDRISTATMCLDQLAICLTAMGQLEEAYQATEEVVKLRRLLASTTPRRYNADLAWSLGNFSEALARRGSFQQAFGAIEEAVALYRPLVDSQPAFQENLAWSLGTLSKRLGEIPIEERPSQKALEAIEEAVAIYRSLMSTQPVIYGQNLAWALGALSSRLADVQRYYEGLAASEESVKICRELLKTRPASAMTPDLALQLRNLAARLWDTNNAREALEVIGEAITLYRQLCLRLPLRYNSELMRSLYSKSSFLMEAGRPKEALTVLEEAIELLGPLATHRPGLYKDSVPQYLRQLTSLYTTLGCPEQAKVAAKRAEDGVLEETTSLTSPAY
ncbi:hypothetical protein CALVIDRAFT_542675 [Calocera viscosa TUFC12733]|uniref:NACHT domain-containing protein n=1 Tax=Calocera viscosa (strain TUFC12733) TaxID=1330018 RepID=A0A167GCQ1_CALVF|nr:hypothetical protein CALVIDRAFT_542675 [Calocera viscosa TUFC12733]